MLQTNFLGPCGESVFFMGQVVLAGPGPAGRPRAQEAARLRALELDQWSGGQLRGTHGGELTGPKAPSSHGLFIFWASWVSFGFARGFLRRGFAASRTQDVVHCPGSDCSHMWLLPRDLRRAKASQAGETLCEVERGFHLFLSFLDCLVWTLQFARVFFLLLFVGLIEWMVCGRGGGLEGFVCTCGTTLSVSKRCLGSTRTQVEAGILSVSFRAVSLGDTLGPLFQAAGFPLWDRLPDPSAFFGPNRCLGPINQAK